LIDAAAILATAAPGLDPIALVSDVSWVDLLGIAAIGFGGGMLGGLVGIGGSLVMIPALTIVYGRDQQLYQAAAMVVNAVVATTATRRHAIAGAIKRRVVFRMVPAAVACVLIGVWASNHLDQRWLQLCFGGFMLYVALQEIRSMLSGRTGGESGSPREGRLALAGVGGATGFVSGLLGIGGGGVAVPMLRGLCRLPLREAIAASAAVMLVSATAGAIAKNTTFASIDAAGAGRGLSASLTLAAILAPTGMLGAWVGASLTHRLNLPTIRIAFIALMVIGGVRMAFG
jgi:uncharacterized membrane protein YfcA